jgi:hypothetical protein
VKPAQSRAKPCLFTEDHDVPPAVDPRRPLAPGVPYCRCGVRKDHPRHQLPDVPEQAVVAGRYERGEVEG